MFALWQQSVSAWSLVDFLCLILVLAGCVGITIIVLRVAGIAVPSWVWQILLIVGAVFLGIVAIRFLTSM